MYMCVYIYICICITIACETVEDGLPRKVVGASCVAVTDFGEEGQAA